MVPNLRGKIKKKDYGKIDAASAKLKLTLVKM